MSDTIRTPITIWSVDYLDGRHPHEIALPHAWKQEVPVTFEGPVSYQTEIDVPKEPCKLVFTGVSYEAQVLLDGELATTHRGIWDAFEVPLTDHLGKRLKVEVRVIKNGGETYPVKEVASGFLPFVYHTFGGIHGEVDLVPIDEPEPGDLPAPPTRLRVEGHKLFVDDRPFYPRGLLHWGWYPNVGHTHAPAEVIREEVRKAKALGFNLVKFCLWVPPHRYLEILKEEGMEAWLELPLWDPTSDPAKLEAIAQEMERIVRQYRRHDNILIWTVGCELSESTPAEYRRDLVRMVQNLTGCPMVKDNSGGAEMYGGDLREYGDFYDYHPYCDTPFYPEVLDNLTNGPRQNMPILLGEFNDIDAHRDLARLEKELPYWISSLPELNDQGVRWQLDLPTVIPTNRFANQPDESRHAALMESSRQKAIFIRKTVHEAVRARDNYAGYVITGWRDTPISSAGFFDDWDQPRYAPRETAAWNGPACLFLIPTRRPPWVNGGNRPGYLDPFNHFTGQLFWKVGIHSDTPLTGGLVWKLVTPSGEVAARGTADGITVPALESTEVGQIHWDAQAPGEYELQVEFAGVTNRWPIWVVEKPDWKALEGWSLADPRGLVAPFSLPEGDRSVSIGALSESGISILLDEGTVPMPFWRESANEFLNDDFWQRVPFAQRWTRLLAVSPDRALDMEWLASNVRGDVEVLLNRVDTRTYVETPILVRAGGRLVTTLRPFGGLGTQPTSIRSSPAGSALLRSLMDAL